MLALFYKHRLFGCKTYFDPEYARFFPGRLLFREMITHGHAHGARIMDMNGDSRLVKHFSNFPDDYHILVFNTQPYGRLLHALENGFQKMYCQRSTRRGQREVNYDDHGH